MNYEAMKVMLILAAVGMAVGARAEALNTKHVPADAKWVLHLNADAFRQSKLGAMMVKEVLEPKVHKAESDAKHNFNFSFTKISSLTAFGSRIGEGADRDGALIMRTSADVKADLEKLVAMTALSGGSDGPTKWTDGGVEVYAVGDLFASQAAADTWVISKSRTSANRARDIVAGKAAAGLPAKMLAFPSATNSYFFLAVAETAAEGLPAQAQLLKKAEGARIVMGERADRLFLELALKAPNEDVRTQLQQAAQGLLAFISLAKADDKDAMALANSAKVDNADNFVTVRLSFPIERAMQKVREDNAD